LVKNALRMRPDRVILGEVRADEAFDMLQAMNTGHEGSMATIHANNPREAIGRLEQMIAMGGLAISPDAMRQQPANRVGAIAAFRDAEIASPAFGGCVVVDGQFLAKDFVF
jgi:pilus assembly protein CpaF